MGEVEDVAMKIVHAYEDFYTDKEKRAVFDGILNRYLSLLAEEDSDPYDSLVELGRAYRFEFDRMVNDLKSHSLL
ncbi:MAG: hypothetical protein ACM3ON_09110 [Chloroflexota bacterium]